MTSILPENYRAVCRLLLGLFIAFAPVVGCPAYSSDVEEVEIERLTSEDVGARIAAGADILLIPTGGTENNGRHMVTGKHNFIVRDTARRIALALGSALVAPVIAFVPEGDPALRSGHMAYAGTMSVPEGVFAGVLEGAARSGKAHGFKLIAFIGDSGGNQRAQEKTARRLSAEWAGEGVSVHNVRSYYFGNGGDMWLASEGETEATIGTHGGIRDTSELLAVFPAGVDLDRASGAGDDGTSGDPRRASAERGWHLLDLKVRAAVAEIGEARRNLVTNGATKDGGFFAHLMHLIFG
jgi:creatinine amidohydrolase